ncbi:hypothetical protein [Brevundimonas diminuta]|uniref:hypothetical protein n=1 Tax=Brevundimonas diminuta TaxID=293 RepID=UPI003209135B
MKKIIPLVITISIALPSASATAAQSLVTGRSPLLTAISHCRSVPDDAARLACFDRASEALDVAERQGDLAVMERQQIHETRRQLFGFNAPALPSFFTSGGDGSDDEVSAIETTLVSAGQDHEGKWTFRLADGSEWRQIDSAPVRFQNRQGIEARVRRAALGSYLLTVAKSRAVRVKRQ